MTDAATWGISSVPTEVTRTDAGVLKRETWEMPVEEDFLLAFLSDVFENHWQGIRFGP